MLIAPQDAPQAHPDAPRLVKKLLEIHHKDLSPKPPHHLRGWHGFPNLISLNQDGNAYQPYGPAGIPYSLGGGSSVRWSPMGQDGNQALAYLDSAPGAGAREAYQQRTCNPLWSNVFGCREGK